MRRSGTALALAAVALAATCTRNPAPTLTRLETIQQRGTLGCGVDPVVPGFAEVDASGRYRGLDVDICRAVAAAIFGSPDKVTFTRVASVAEFRRLDAIDIVSRRLTWELGRERPFGLLFGPITFYDGQGFLVSASSRLTELDKLGGREVCVAEGTEYDTKLDAFVTARGLTITKINAGDPHALDSIARSLASGRCHIYTSDISLLAPIRQQTGRPNDFAILDQMISREPLAPLVRDDDAEFFDIVRWTVFALIEAEALGVTSTNVDDQRKNSNADVQRLLGVRPGNGKALGLREDWAYNAIKGVGNYGELFEKHVGHGSPLGLGRGLNRLAKDGGLMYAPPLR